MVSLKVRIFSAVLLGTAVMTTQVMGEKTAQAARKNPSYVSAAKEWRVSVHRHEDELERLAAAQGFLLQEERLAAAQGYLSHEEWLRANILQDARKYLGTPYLFGAQYGQTETFDCSSFVKTVFAENGIDLPRVSRIQAKKGIPINRSRLQAGDLLFFTTDSSRKIGHVGIYAGSGMMIHTYGKGGVKFSSIEKGWWKMHYAAARRLIHN